MQETKPYDFYKEIMEQKSPADIHRVLVQYEDQLGAV